MDCLVCDNLVEDLYSHTLHRIRKISATDVQGTLNLHTESTLAALEHMTPTHARAATWRQGFFAGYMRQVSKTEAHKFSLGFETAFREAGASNTVDKAQVMVVNAKQSICVQIFGCGTCTAYNNPLEPVGQPCTECREVARDLALNLLIHKPSKYPRAMWKILEEVCERLPMRHQKVSEVWVSTCESLIENQPKAMSKMIRAAGTLHNSTFSNLGEEFKFLVGHFETEMCKRLEPYPCKQVQPRKLSALADQL